MKRLDETVYVAGQIAPESVAKLGAMGLKTIVNNRPDGEEPGQPSSASLAAEAEAAGIEYRHIPISGAFPDEAVDGMLDALESAEGPVLVFCRSGMRSAFLWGLARAKAGDPGRTILNRAAAAGYDLSPIRHYLPGPI